MGKKQFNLAVTLNQWFLTVGRVHHEGVKKFPGRGAQGLTRPTTWKFDL